MAAAEDQITRCYVNRHQQLLSKSQEYSPRNNLGRRWREYHGSNDWAGLLDPLDENLRRGGGEVRRVHPGGVQGFPFEPRHVAG